MTKYQRISKTSLETIKTMNTSIYKYYIYKQKYSELKIEKLVIIEIFSRNIIYLEVVKWIDYLKFQ